MKIYKTLQERLETNFFPKHLEILDESHKHGGNLQESHFHVILVSSKFVSLSMVKRHQDVYRTLNDLLKDRIHALSLRTYTQEEWEKESSPLKSPPCLGKS